ncbi:MAG: RimK family protein [Spirochaetes bacterium]|nr:RimK family protein [Spirochaetota bacterium]
MNTIVVLEKPSNWKLNIPGVKIVKANDYVTDAAFSDIKKIKVLNLCRSYKYQTIGYYVSLIAAARGHYPIPSVKATQDLKQSLIIKRASHDLDIQIQKSLAQVQGENYELNIYFGRNASNSHNRLSNMIYNVFPLPFFKASFHKVKNRWQLDSISLITIKDIPENHINFAVQRIIDYVGRKSAKNHKDSATYKYDLAILRTEGEENSPSNKEAIDKFMKSADKNGVRVEIITSNDIAQLNRFDALFIRDTTAVNHYTYRFARRAESSGLVVIDDPISILRCTNKIYLTEVLQKNKIPTPPTVIISQNNIERVEKEIGFPCVLKTPDSSFSLGVFKYDTKQEFESALPKLFKKSALLLVQAFIPTDFDWRVCVLNDQPLFVCRYHMAKAHWQIYNHASKGTDDESGLADTLAVSDSPKKVIDVARKATGLIGHGLYGVDIKVIDGKPQVIEINDNPSIDAGIEDMVLGDKLYDAVIKEFIRWLDTLHGKNGKNEKK